MGKVIVDIILTNFGDTIAVERGYISKDQIRMVKTKGFVDTGSTMLSIPQTLFDELGLSYSGKEVTATYANGKKEKRKIARGLVIEINDRDALVDCIVEEKYDKVLIGQIPLEEMDLYVDCKNGCLVPRAESPDMPMIEIL